MLLSLNDINLRACLQEKAAVPFLSSIKWGQTDYQSKHLSHLSYELSYNSWPKRIQVSEYR